MMLNISPKTVQAWEQGSREPGDAALKLLTIAKNHPEVLLESLTCKISTFSIGFGANLRYPMASKMNLSYNAA